MSQEYNEYFEALEEFRESLQSYGGPDGWLVYIEKEVDHLLKGIPYTSNFHSIHPEDSTFSFNSHEEAEELKTLIEYAFDALEEFRSPLQEIGGPDGYLDTFEKQIANDLSTVMTMQKNLPTPPTMTVPFKDFGFREVSQGVYKKLFTLTNSNHISETISYEIKINDNSIELSSTNIIEDNIRVIEFDLFPELKTAILAELKNDSLIEFLKQTTNWPSNQLISVSQPTKKFSKKL